MGSQKDGSGTTTGNNKVDSEYQRILKLYKGHSFQEAEEAATKLLIEFPQFAPAHNLLGAINLAQGSLENALPCFQRAVAIKPDHQQALGNLGQVLVKLGRHEEALTPLTKALSGKSGSAEAHNQLGTVYADLGSHEEAISYFRQAIKLQPEFADAHCNLGNSFNHIGEVDSAIKSLSTATRLNPEHQTAHYNLGTIYSNSNSYLEACVHLEKALQLKPDSEKTLSNLGKVYFSLSKYDLALTVLQKAQELAPTSAEPHNRLGVIHYERGDYHLARYHLKQAIALRPNYHTAHRHLSKAIKYKPSEPHIKQLHSLLENPENSANDRMQTCYALGKVYDDLQDYDRAYDYFAKANAIRGSELENDRDTRHNFFRILQTCFKKEMLARSGYPGNPSEQPVFIVGLPRSGKTSLERIFSHHPELHGAGELSYFNLLSRVFNTLPDDQKDVLNLNIDELKERAEAYIHALKMVSNGERFVINTMPENFYNIGLIKLVFPNAKVVHCTRDSKDNCIEIYKKYFFADKHSYAYAMDDIVDYYLGYHGLMEHWETEFPGFVKHIQFEDLVNSDMSSLRSVFAQWDLSWNDTWADSYTSGPNKSDYQTSLGSWKNYSKQFGDMFKQLDGLAPISRVL